MTDDLIALVRDANPERTHTNLDRRCWKLLEDTGEVAEAYLNVSSASNGKGKTWDDVREEIADVLIVTLDIVLTRLPGEASDLLPPVNIDSAIFIPVVGRSGLDNIFDMVSCLRHFLSAIRIGFFPSARLLALGLARHAAALSVTALPDQPDRSHEDIIAALQAEVRRKLLKWETIRRKMTVVTDDA